MTNTAHDKAKYTADGYTFFIEDRFFQSAMAAKTFLVQDVEMTEESADEYIQELRLQALQSCTK